MKTHAVAEHLRVISQLKALNGEPHFAVAAYEHAAKEVSGMAWAKQDIETTNLEGLPGFGDSIRTAIRQFITNGTSNSYEALVAKFPVEMLTMTAVTGIGPKKAYKLYQKGYRNLKDLAIAAEAGQLDAKLADAVKTAMLKADRLPYHIIQPVSEKLQLEIASLAGVSDCVVAGSIRRMSTTSKDIDLVTCVDAGAIEQVITRFTQLGKPINAGASKSSIHIEVNGQMVQSDLWVSDKAHFGALLQYATGSKDHNIRLRNLAIAKGWKLNEKGLFDASDNMIAGETEQSIYDALGHPFTEPQYRVY